MRAALLEIVRGQHHERDVAVLGREMPAFLGAARIHQRRERLLDRLRHGEALVDLDELSFVVEILLARPQKLHHLDPFGRMVVAGVVLHLRHAEHLELRGEPAADDVKREASVGDVIQ